MNTALKPSVRTVLRSVAGVLMLHSFLVVAHATVPLAMPSGIGSLIRFDNGYYSAYASVTTQNRPNVAVLNRDGKVLYEASVRFPEVVRVALTDTATDSDGALAAAGTAVQADGTVADFIAVTDRSGSITKVIRTNPYVVMGLCFASDGNIWATVRNLEVDNLQTSSKPDYNVVQRYSRAGAMTGSWLPLSSFGTGLHPAARGGGTWSHYIRSGNGRIAVLFSGAGKFYEFLNAGTALPGVERRIGVHAAMMGFAYTPDGGLYAAYSHGGLVRFDRTSGEWEKAQENTGTVNYLYGSDGGSLVLRRGPAGYADVAAP